MIHKIPVFVKADIVRHLENARNALTAAQSKCRFGDNWYPMFKKIGDIVLEIEAAEHELFNEKGGAT